MLLVVVAGYTRTLFFLPLANSLLDFMSFEVSRYLTGKILNIDKKWIIASVLLTDLIVAVFLLIGTAWMIILFIEGYNFLFVPLLENHPPLDWREMARLARDYPFTRGMSITFMLFSTLIWTAIHAIIAFFPLLLAPSSRKLLLDYLDSQKEITNVEASIGAFWICANLALSMVCLFVIPYFVISFFMKQPIADLLYDIVMRLPTFT